MRGVTPSATSASVSLREPTDRLAVVRLPEGLRGPVVHAGGGAKGHLQFQEVAFVPGAELDGRWLPSGYSGWTSHPSALMKPSQYAFSGVSIRSK